MKCRCSVARENTLHSLNSAAKCGADLVEFDVHLTKDEVITELSRFFNNFSYLDSCNFS